MNLEIHHKASQFTETHPQSLKELPLMETLDAEILPGYESLIIRFQVAGKEPKQFVKATKPVLDRLEKYFCKRGDTAILKGKWKHVSGGKEVVEDAGGTKHEEITYAADYFVFEGVGSTLALRIQGLGDKAKIVFCPPDQTREFKVRWTGDVELTLVLSSVRIAGVDPLDDEIAKLQALDVADLQTLAPQFGIKWDEKASTDTMVRKLAEKRLAKKNKPAKAPKPELQPA